MNDDDLTGFKILEGELKEHELAALMAMGRGDAEDDTDAYLLFLSPKPPGLVPC